MITNQPDLEQGLIETMLVIDGAVVELEAHLERLERSTLRLYDASLPAGLHTAMESSLRSLPTVRAARLRVAVWPMSNELGYHTEAEPTAQHLFNPLSGTGLRLRPATVAGGLGAHKWRDRSLIAQLGEGLGPEEELVIVDDDGEVLETGAGNLFAVFENRITTPPADHRLLPGVTRRRLLELACALGLIAVEHPLELDELSGATEILVTSAVRGVVPVIKCGENDWTMGEFTLRLRRALTELWSLSFAARDFVAPQ